MTHHEKRHSIVCPHGGDCGGETVALPTEGRERFIKHCPVYGTQVRFHMDMEHGSLTGLSTEIHAIPRFRLVPAAAPRTVQ